MSKIKVTLTVEAHGQSVTLHSDDSSGDNPAFALHDVNVTMADFNDQLRKIVPAMVGTAQR